MNEAEGVCVYVRVREVVKEMKDWKIQRWKGSEGKTQTPSAQPSQHVPITAALKQSPARRCFWPILGAGGDERKRFERGKTGGGVLREAHERGEGESRAERGQGDNLFIWERGRLIKTENERERKGQWGHKPVRKWEHWSTRGKKEREGSTLQWAIVRDDQSATLSWVNKQGPGLQVQFLP